MILKRINCIIISMIVNVRFISINLKYLTIKKTDGMDKLC